MPAGETYVKIASQTLASAAASVNFTNIPQIFTDLRLVISGSYQTSLQDIQYRINGDTGSNYSRTYIYGDGSSAVSGKSSTFYISGLDTNQSVCTWDFLNYSNSAIFKTYLVRSASASWVTAASVGLWRNTSGINNLWFAHPSGTNFSAGTSFTLYGITSSVAPQASGGTITTDGTYWIHTFTSSGVFTPISGLNVDYMVLAGGGGGAAGGGGAGGLRSTVTASGRGSSVESRINLSPGSYVVTVGAGGNGNNSYSGGAATKAGDNGSDSVFASITSLGGGGGGSAGNNSFPYVAKNGGCGGGASYSSGTANRGLGTAGQGYDGGADTIDAAPYPGPGGGGTGQDGQSPPNSSTAGAGGNGTAVSISGSSVTYGGGGGGGLYGGGSGGAGGTGGGGSYSGGNGTANLGGGGAGAIQNATGGNGGSGIVIVRYPR